MSQTTQVSVRQSGEKWKIEAHSLVEAPSGQVQPWYVCSGLLSDVLQDTYYKNEFIASRSTPGLADTDLECGRFYPGCATSYLLRALEREISLSLIFFICEIGVMIPL